MSWLGRIFRRKRRTPSKRIISALEVINRERERLLSSDGSLSAAMKLVAGSPLSRLEASAAIQSGAFGNVFNRRLTATYDAAQTNDLNVNHWRAADALAADSANSPAVRKVLRQRARYECENNCIAKGIGESIANDLAGTGPRLSVDDPRIPVAIRAKLAAAFNGWLRSAGIAKKIRTMRRARRVDGEAFAALVTNERLAGPVKLDVKLIETEQVASPRLTMPDARHIDGIDLDENGNPVMYHVLKGHPGAWGETASATEDIEVPAAKIVHWFRQSRPGQHRGVSEMTAGLPLYALLRRYNLAVVQAAESAADFAMFMKTTASPDALAEVEDYDAAGNAVKQGRLRNFDLFPLHRNMVTQLPDGYDIGQTKPEQPINTHDKFVVAIVREIARNESVSLNVALGTSADSSFASGQLDHRIYYRPREIERAELDDCLLDPLFAAWFAEAVLIEGYLPQELRSLTFAAAPPLHSFHWPSNELGDPLKLAAAKATRLKTGQTSIPAIYADMGLNWRQEFETAAEAMGLTFAEYQEMVRDAIFAGSAEQDTGDDDKATGSGRQQPQQQAARRANA